MYVLYTFLLCYLACKTAILCLSCDNHESISLHTLHSRSSGGANRGGHPTSFTCVCSAWAARLGSDKLNTYVEKKSFQIIHLIYSEDVFVLPYNYLHVCPVTCVQLVVAPVCTRRH